MSLLVIVDLLGEQMRGMLFCLLISSKVPCIFSSIPRSLLEAPSLEPHTGSGGVWRLETGVWTTSDVAAESQEVRIKTSEPMISLTALGGEKLPAELIDGVSPFLCCRSFVIEIFN
jgi:hypothetical protein